MARVAAVTGSEGGIGGAIVRALRDAGLEVIGIDRRGAGVVCDLAAETEVRGAAREVLQREGRCDVFVHAAAAFDQAPLAEIDAATWRHVQAVNVEAALWFCQELAPELRTREHGRVVFIVSDTVWGPPGPPFLPYVTSKAALIGMARVLAGDLGRSGVTVNCVAPGLTPTPTTRAELRPEAFEAVRARQAVPRLLHVDDVAAAVAFLASEGAGAVTGQTICTNAGLVMR